jgi:hypothetical protein
MAAAPADDREDDDAGAAAPPPKWPHVEPSSQTRELSIGWRITLHDHGDGTGRAEMTGRDYLPPNPPPELLHEALKYLEPIMMAHAEIAWLRAGDALRDRMAVDRIRKDAQRLDAAQEGQRESRQRTAQLRQRRFDFVLSYLMRCLGLDQPPGNYHQLIDLYWDFEQTRHSRAPASPSARPRSAESVATQRPGKDTRIELHAKFTPMDAARPGFRLLDLPGYRQHRGSDTSFLVRLDVRNDVALRMLGLWKTLGYA